MVKTFRLPDCFKDWCNCSMMDILPLLLDMEARHGELQMTPSSFLREMQLSTEQRYEQLIRPMRNVPALHDGQKTFKVMPDIIVFQNFNLGVTYSVQLTLMNIHETPRPLKIFMEPTTYFSIRHSSESVCTKVAPGLKYTLEVRFSAEHFKDYKHQITFITADETFDVPMVAIGPRPLLDLPDRIVIPKTAVNIQTERTILVRNIGQVLASFIMEPSECFSLKKTRDILKPNELFQLTIYFHPKTLGLIQGEMKLTYETGEMLYVRLEGLCEEADVKIDTQRVYFDDTFFGLSQERVVTLRNDSEYVVDFKWTLHDCEECEAAVRSSIKERFEDMMDFELDRDNKLMYHGFVDKQMNRDIYERILCEEKKNYDGSKEVLFRNDNFKIAPISGQLWPNTKVNCSIIYIPSNVDIHKSLAFLYINGRLKRYHLEMFGSCIGPSIAINLEELDAQNIYIGSVHRYEVVFQNTGPIAGVINYINEKSVYGGEFKCSNPTFTICSEEIVSLYIEFTSLTRGKFVEKISFEIAGSNKTLSFLMSGNIVCPLLNFDVTELDFGDMSVGQTKLFNFRLENNTQVSIEYCVNILESSSSCESFWEPSIQESLEFTCSSREGIVMPYSHISYWVQVTPSAAIDKYAELAIYMWESRQQSRTVYLKYKAHVPLIECLTPLIAIKSMFITQTYYRTITLENKSDYMGQLTLKTVTDEEEMLMLKLENLDTFIEPWVSYEFRLEVRTDVIGDMKGRIVGFFSGAQIRFTICDIVVISRGPCIDVDLMDTNIGKVKTLVPIEKRFVLSNDSPIDATVYVSITGPYITACNPVIELKPEQTVESHLKIYGTSSGKFKTSVKLEIEGAEPDCVIISGEFVGGSISTSPKLDPYYNVGSISTLTNFIQEIKFLNEGKVSHNITFKEFETEIKPNIVSVHDNGRPFFVLSNNQFVISAGKMQSLFFDCFSKFACQVSTRFVCSAKKQSRKNLITRKIFDFKIMASFEVPHVTLSKQFMEFRIDVGMTQTVAVVEDDIQLMNQSNVTLHMEITIEEPFFFIVNETSCSRQDVTLEASEQLEVIVRFSPELTENRIQLRRGMLKIQYIYHPTTEKLPLFGIVNYPNVAFEPNYVDFGCIPVGHTSYKLIKLRNISPLQVEFNFEISKDDFSITRIEFVSKDCHLESRASSYDSMKDLLDAADEQIPEEMQIIVNEEMEEEEENDGKMEEEEAEEEKRVENDEYTITTNTSLLDSEDCLELAKITLANEALAEELRDILHPILDEFDKRKEIDNEIYRILSAKQPIQEDRFVIDLVPRCGTLAPYECQIVSIAVNPPPWTEIAGTVMCNVSNGACTALDIFAKSGDIMYNLKSDVCDFGIVAFNQVAEISFPIDNIGYAKFPYCIRYANPNAAFIAEPGWMSIFPETGIVTEENSIDVQIKYFPGIPGYFETVASLEIEFFDPIKITIRGCAVLPQYCFEFPRPLNDEMNVLSYAAIADITYHCHSICRETYTLEVQPDFNDWEFVRYKRHYPSVQDIAMAIERKIIQRHLQTNIHLVAFKFANPSAIIPDLVLPPYVIDLGYVILNSVTDILISPLKYSDSAMKLFWIRVPRKCFENGFSMLFQKGMPGPFLVFKPTPKMFPDPNTEIVGHFSCIIAATMKIDFEVKAVVTVPSLIFKHNSIDFGRVQCGFCLRKSVYLQNNGAVPCSYKCLIQSSSERPSNIFFTKARDGVVDAREFANIDIYFQPQSHTKYEWRLIVLIEANKQPLKITLRGFGILPELAIIDEKIFFEPTLPYSINNIKYFKIMNRSQFPVEICFTDFDSELDREGAIIKTLLNYYNVKKLFIPPRHVGCPLPSLMIDRYNFLMENLKGILKKKIRHEYVTIVRKYTNEDRSPDPALIMTLSNVEALEIPDPLEDKTYEEIQALLLENLAELKTKETSELSILKRGSIFEIEVPETAPIEKRDSTKLNEGVLIIFHGSPLTDFVFAANKAARTLKIPVLNIDQLIYDALIANDLLAANKVNHVIKSTFDEIASETKVKTPKNYDAFDILKARVALILSGRSKHVTSKKSIDKKGVKDVKKAKGSIKSASTKLSDRPTIKTTVEKSDTFLRLPLELFYELIKSRLKKYSAGLVVESLNSIFITKPNLALIGLLQGVGNIRYMHGVYFSVSAELYNIKQKEEKLKAKELSNEMHDTLDRILHMDAGEFDCLTVHEMNMYRRFYLRTRKADTARRLAARVKRLKDKNKPKKSVLVEKFKEISKSHKLKEPPIMSTKASTKGSRKHEVQQPQPQSVFADAFEESLVLAEYEALEISHIFENWHRVNGKLIVPLPTKIPKKKVKEPKIEKVEKVKQEKVAKRDSKTSKGSRKSNNTRKTSAISADSKKSRVSADEESFVDIPKKIDIKNLTDEEMKERNNIGIPFWFVNNAHTDSKIPHYDLVSQYLFDDEDLSESLYFAYLATLDEHKDHEQLYTVLTETKTDRFKNSSNEFVLYDFNGVLQESVQSSKQESEIVLQTSKSVVVRKSGGSFRKSSASLFAHKQKRKKISSTQHNLSLTNKSLIPRRIMQPDDVLAFEVNFYPETCGVFAHHYYIEIVTLPIPFRVYLEGKADIPTIYMDPAMMFSKMLPDKEGHDLSIAYFEKEEVLHLGAIAAQPEDSRIECLIAEDKLNLINDSYLTCDLTVDFLDITSDFSLDAYNILILSNNSHFLTLRGHPVKPGNIHTSMVLTTQNNPRVNCIKISSIGTNFAIDITPHNVFFERVLLNRHVKIDVELKNLSLIGANWEIDFREVMDKYGISETSGYIRPFGTNVVIFTYEATEYSIVPIQEIQIKFYDKFRHCERPILIETIKLSAEVVEVGIEYETDVQLGDIKIGQLYTSSYLFTNKSKFSLRYNFTPLADSEDTEEILLIKKSTMMDPSEGPIKPNDITKVPVKFKTNFPIEFKSVPIFKCSIVDPLIQREVLHFVLKVTGKVFSSIYKLCPSEELVFSPQLVDTEVNKDIVLHNTGKYSFTFVILNSKKEDPLKKRKSAVKGKGKTNKKSSKSKSTKSSKRSSKSSRKSKSSKKTAKSSKKSNKKARSSSTIGKKMKQTALKQGIFTIVPSTGVVQPHTETYIRITCKPTKVGVYAENIAFFISGVTGKLTGGHVLSLQGSACLPEIDFIDLVDIFKQHMIVETFEDALCLQQVMSNCLFVLVDKQFFFNGTCLHLEKEARVRIRNSGEIGAHVRAQITNGNEVFRVVPEKHYIEAYKYAVFSIYFKPLSLDKSTASLNLSVELSTLTLSIGLNGEGCLPIVKVVEPPFNDQNNTYQIDYKLVLLENKVQETIKLSNPGLLDSRVVVGVQGDELHYVALEGVTGSLADPINEQQEGLVLQEVFQHTRIFDIKAQDTMVIHVAFTPKTEIKLDCYVNIFVSNNPYEIFKIRITGQGYKENIIIEQLESFIMCDDGNSLVRSLDDDDYSYTLLSYNLHFGYKHINKLNKKWFKIKNISEDSTYKFVFTSLYNVNFVPAIGHLHPLASKDVIVTLYSKEAVSYENELLLCKICKIAYVQPTKEQLSWDERQHCTIWMPVLNKSDSTSNGDDEQHQQQHNIYFDGTRESAKIVQCKEEPENNEIPDSRRAIRLMLNIIIDYCYYETDTLEVTFPDTTIFQESKEYVTIRNPSRVPVDINWYIRVGNYPRINSVQESLQPVQLSQYPKVPKSRPTSCYFAKRPQLLSGNEKFIELERPKSSQHAGSIFSGLFSSAINSVHSYCDSDPLPLTITPIQKLILPNSSFTFTFKFAPFTAVEYMFWVYSEIPNLQPHFTPLQLKVLALSDLPLYHFKIDHSDYLTNRRGTRRSCEIEEIEEGTKVLEFEAIGFGIPVTTKFSIINPTGEHFTYRWEKSVKERNVALFQCESPEGSVGRGKTADAIFSFIAQKCGTFEMFYYFMIEKYDLRVMFLLVGHAREPCVFFHENGMILKPTLMGIDVHEVAVFKNLEDIALSYKVNNASLYHEGRLHKIGIEPLKTIMPAKSETPIKITFHPSKIGNFTFNVEFCVDRLQKPVVLTINATCYNVQPTLKLVKEFSTHDLMIETENIIPMPVLVQKHPESCKFYIGNVGFVGFYFKWDLNDQFIEDFVYLDITPKEAYVKAGSEIEAYVIVKAVKFLSRKYIRLLLKIIYGPTIPITLVCSTCKSKIKFSETLHDFGACLAQKHNTLNNEWTLEISNNDYVNYNVQVLNRNFSHITILKKETVLSPKKNIKIRFYFHPKEITKFNTVIDILINDKPYPITILGEGVSMEVELLDIKDKFLDLGPVALGKNVKKRVHIVNKTKCLVSIYFELYHRLPIFNQSTRHLEPDFEHIDVKPSSFVVKKEKAKKSGKKSKKSSKSSKKTSKSSKKSKSTKTTKSTKSKKSKKSKGSKGSKKSKKSKKEKKKKVEIKKKEPEEPVETLEEKQRRLINSAIRIRPLKWIKLFPQNSTEFTITYMPTERMPVFQEQVYCQVEDTIIPLCAIKASCIAPQFSLYKNKITFGTVILGSSNKFFTKLINSGDVGGKFKWSWKTSKTDSFLIDPMEGYSSPGTCTTFEVIFRPAYIQCVCTSCAKLTIENYKTALDLDLSGTCINLPNPSETLRFAGPVRESFTKKFTVKNSTPEPWTIRPSITGWFFHVDDLIVVEAKSSYTGEVTYNPLTMTQGKKYHEGKLFLPLPEGQGILYDLIGESLRPNTSEVIEKTMSSKTYNLILLDVNNWLKATQQFTVVNQVDQPDAKNKVLYKLTGNTIIDVPPLTAKPYKWIIYTLNEGKLNFKVKFRNEVSREYICYELKLTLIKCQVLDTFVLNTCARQVAELKLKLENPLCEETVYKLSSSCPDLHFVREATVPPYTEIEILVEYKPLYPVTEFTTVFEAVSPKLGTFPYSFVLSANNAEPESTITVKAPLGLKTVKHSYIYNSSDSDTEFTAKLENSEFTVEKHVIVPAKEKGFVEIGFEPSDLGGVHSKLSLSSPTLGVYIFPLYGIGELPKPQGPYVVKDNFQTFIPFKNPFTFGMTFDYAVSTEQFLLKVSYEVLKPRSTTRINISCRREAQENNNTADLKSKLTGQLIIKCADDGYNHIQWVMYLHNAVN